jgi:hypothetical protein
MRGNKVMLIKVNVREKMSQKYSVSPWSEPSFLTLDYKSDVILAAITLKIV